MDFKPGEFFVGIVDFFAILMPGALLAYATKDWASQKLFGPILPKIEGEVQGWVAFILAAYLLGHFIFLLGAVLDRYLYDPYRKRRLRENHDRLFKRARLLKRRALRERCKAPVLNTYKWARTNVQLFQPAAAVEIHRLEADSKFFRSLVVLLFLLTLFLLYKGALLALAMSSGLMLLSFIRYADQRYKSTQLAYTCLLAMDHRKSDKPESAPKPA
ncbi:MAG: hypothetical protein JNM09_14650 [Blastocatellia bacterium]|nr:hypothetical protein [Blastocatellia bacterium]